MTDEAPKCADAQTGAGAATGADANTDAHPGQPVQTGAGSPTGSDEETEAHTGPTAPVSDADAAVPLFRGLSKDHSSLRSITGWGEGGKLPDIKDWTSIKHLFGPKPKAEDLKKEVIWRSQHLNLNPAPKKWSVPQVLLWLFNNPAPPGLVPPERTVASPAPASGTGPGVIGDGHTPDSAAKEARFTKNHCLVRLVHAISSLR